MVVLELELFEVVLLVELVVLFVIYFIVRPDVGFTVVHLSKLIQVRHEYKQAGHTVVFGTELSKYFCMHTHRLEVVFIYRWWIQFVAGGALGIVGAALTVVQTWLTFLTCPIIEESFLALTLLGFYIHEPMLGLVTGLTSGTDRTGGTGI
jgi:hypothetical protein